jgi:hypothetical protein
LGNLLGGTLEGYSTRDTILGALYSGYPMEGYPMEGYHMEGYPMEGYPMEGFYGGVLRRGILLRRYAASALLKLQLDVAGRRSLRSEGERGKARKRSRTREYCGWALPYPTREYCGWAAPYP